MMEQSEFEKLREKVSHVMWNEIEPLSEEIEKTRKVPKDILWPKFRDCGFFGLVVPKQYGGLELSHEQYVWFEKEWAKLQGGIRVILHVHNLGAEMVARHGREDQKRSILPLVAQGEVSVAFALTERNAGTGKDIKTNAVRKGSKYVINGEKHLITNADFAKYFIVVCRSGEGWTNFLIERDTPGFVIKDMPETMGCIGSYHGILEFHDCEVSEENILGVEGRGLEDALETLRISRIYIAANALGVCERCLESSLKRSKERVTFGKPIAQRQAIQTYLAEMAMCTYCLRLVMLDAARTADKLGKPGVNADLCKLYAIEAVRRVTDLALLVHGGLGYTREFAIERMYRDARLNWLEEGTPTIHKFEVARRFLNGEFSGEGLYPF